MSHALNIHNLPAGLLDTGIAQASDDDAVARIWKRDASLWAPLGTPEVADRLGWLDVADKLESEVAGLEALTAELLSEGYTDAILLGMGGSSLGPLVIDESFGKQTGGLRLQVLDSTHPDAVLAVEASVDLAHTVFIVSSKSGGTIETLSHYAYFKQRAKPEQFIVVTDPGSPLAARAEREGLRRTFLNPADIGGRYSVMSFFGLVPAALAGVPVKALIGSAQAGARACGSEVSADLNTGLTLGVIIGRLAQQGVDKLTVLASKPFESFGLWLEQLVAESTGKQGKGILPVADEPLGEPSAYGDDRVFLYLRNEDAADPVLEARTHALRDAGQPLLALDVAGSPAELGRLFFISEFATAIAGYVLGINPFDQPNVQEAKDNTSKVLAEGVPEIPSGDDAALISLLSPAKPPHYIAILGYLPTHGPQNSGIDAAIVGLRTAIRDHTGAATTWGYGPRFQHSTGQEHKGGAPHGRFLQLVNVPEGKAEIPGETYDFTTLIDAASAGDLQTLAAHNLPAVRVVLEGELAAAIHDLTTRIRGLLGA